MFSYINFNPIKNEFEFYYAAILGEKCSYEFFDAMMLNYKSEFLEDKKAVRFESTPSHQRGVIGFGNSFVFALKPLWLSDFSGNGFSIQEFPILRQFTQVYAKLS